MFKEGYVYHIKDSYFAKANDDKLMRNKENGTYRPTFLCLEDKKNPGLLWIVPMSTRTEKFQAIHDKQEEHYGKCLSIVMGEFDGKPAAFLLQNMFPITEQYLDHIHTRNGNPVPVKYTLAQQVRSNMQRLRQLINAGKNVVFPDVRRLETLMLSELAQQKGQQQKQNTSMKDRMADAQARAEQQTHQKMDLPDHKKQER